VPGRRVFSSRNLPLVGRSVKFPLEELPGGLTRPYATACGCGLESIIADAVSFPRITLVSPADVNLPYHARPADVVPQAPKSTWGVCRFVLPLKLKRRAGPPEPKRLFAPVPKKPRAAPGNPHRPRKCPAVDTNIRNLSHSIQSYLQTSTSEFPESLRYLHSRSVHAGHPQESHMSTLRQIEANRRNAQKSTGPASVTGKAVSSMNAIRTGIHAKSLILPTEKLADLEELIEEYYRHHQPASPEARLLVDDLITCEWTLRRLGAAETQAWKYQERESWTGPEKYPLGKSATVHPNTFSKLQYRLDATRRAIHRALQALKQLRAEAGAGVPSRSDPIPPGHPLVQPEPPSLSLSPQTPSPGIGFVPSTPFPAPPDRKSTR